MVKLLKIVKSSKPDKKYMAVFLTDTNKEKTVHFGAKNYTDYILSGSDDKLKNAYRARHAKDLETKDPTRAGYLSWFVLWNKPTLSASIADYKQRFNL